MPDFNVSPIDERGIGADVTDAVTIDYAMAFQPAASDVMSPRVVQVIAALQKEVHFRWEQRTAFSFRLQDLRHEMMRAGIDDTSTLYEALHNVTATAEGWMHPGTLSEAAGAHLAALKHRIFDLEQRLGATQDELADVRNQKDNAYLERNQVVAAFAATWPIVGVTKTAIEGWSPDWHSCIYVDLPQGQVSWHFHDSHANLFATFPEYKGAWDGHTTEEKYTRLGEFVRWANGGGGLVAPAVPVESLGRDEVPA